MRKAIIVSVFGLIFMAATLAMIKITIDKWATSSLIHDVLRFVALLVWVYWTYNVVTLKYKWLRKLAGINGE